jgi:hypothetical protein
LPPAKTGRLRADSTFVRYSLSTTFEYGDDMNIEQVEIYSDASNSATIRHPGRAYPGVLAQGDTLHVMAGSLRYVMEHGACLDEQSASRLRKVAERLDEMLAHYRSALAAHRIQLPFRDCLWQK